MPPNSRAQLALEYVVITGFILAIAGIIFGFSLLSFNENSSLTQAQDAVSRLVAHANIAASLGDGSRIFFYIDLPEGVESFSLSGKSVNMLLARVSGDTQVYDYSKANLTPIFLPTSKGRKSLSAQYSDGNVVVSVVS
ncbi:MAG TPA: hypothetical protein VJG83_03360 [archaeon]|nr:hypothetical protein [archaeon]